MGHTNTTPNYSLPQFITTDKPAWLTDINNAFLAIDTGIDAAKDAADNAQNDATQAISDASGASTTASAADAKGSGAIASIADTFDATATYNIGEKVMYNSLLYICTVAVTTPGPWTGSTNWTRTTCEAITDGLETQIASKLSDTDLGAGGYTAVGLTPTGCSIWGGTGYYQIGNLVFVNLRLVVSNAIAGDTVIMTGLPASYNQFTSVANNKGIDLIITEAGQLYTSSNIPAGTLGVTVAYLTHS